MQHTIDIYVLVYCICVSVFVCRCVSHMSRIKRKCLFEQTHSERYFCYLCAKYVFTESITETWNFNWNDDNLSKQKKYTKSNISMHKNTYINNFFSLPLSMRYTDEMYCHSLAPKIPTDKNST